MKKALVLITLFIFNLANSQVHKEYFDNGKLKEIGKYKKGEQEGVWKYYYQNGQLESKTTYVNGDKIGSYEAYLQNGSPTRKGNYKKVKEVGAFGSYYTSKPSGIWYYWEYHSNGKLYYKKIIDEDTGFDIGKYECYYENGELQEKGKFVNNKKDGEWYFNIDFERNHLLKRLHPVEGKYKIIYKKGEPINFKYVNSQFDPIEDNELYELGFKNNCNKKIQVAVRYVNLDGNWKTYGFYTLNPKEEFTLGKTKNSVYYLYALSIDGKDKWKGIFKKFFRGKHYDFKKVMIYDGYGKYTKVLNCN
ncbi:MORN repeat variant [Polaribacter sp. KT25b]|uniref:DUF1036 domain-containing protein n=1 Tax=Polaribacter sp. KT25b TaxID=1855336 RepID=UPI000879C160|nr:DUF1036 domain-containing protein [Polaribacter sp. KT25b]SDR96517.1 MORN repeat variant [Polaribacter sp. KT25b]